MLKMAYFRAYWSLFCIKVALVTDAKFPHSIQAHLGATNKKVA